MSVDVWQNEMHIELASLIIGLINYKLLAPHQYLYLM